MSGLLRHLRSHAIGYLALFVALGGTAYAVSLPSNSVGTKQLKNNAVTKKKIKRNAVTTGKVRNATLLGEDFAPGVLLRGPSGPTGATGPTGPVGPTAAFYSVPSDGGSDTSFYPNEASSTTVNLPSAGRVLVFSHTVVHALSCSTVAGCHIRYALYVDGRLITNGTDLVQTTHPEVVADTINLIGISSTLSAGPHTLTVRQGSTANAVFTADASPVIGAVLVGI